MGQGNLDLTQLLVEYGALIEFQEGQEGYHRFSYFRRKGLRPLLLAAIFASLEIVQFLVDRGASIGATDFVRLID